MTSCNLVRFVKELNSNQSIDSMSQGLNDLLGEVTFETNVNLLKKDHSTDSALEAVRLGN